MEPISELEALKFLEAAPVAHIGVVADGVPYVTPMSFVMDGKRILFRTKPGRRFAAIEANPIVSIEVSEFNDENGEWKSVVVRGRASTTTDSETARVTVEKLLSKYEKVLGSPLSRGRIQPLASFPHVVAIEIEEISGMTSSGTFGARTRPGRL